MRKILFLLLLSFCLMIVGCDKTKPTDDEKTNVETKTEIKTEIETNVETNEYVPTDTTLSFSNENSDKVITEPTFDISELTKDVGTDIKPYQIFASGMCLQRDAINRIWGKASKTEHIAIELNGKVYYGNVESREWEVYLPKMPAGGPYEMNIISDLGRITLKDVYIGEVFLLSGQSNMEFQPQHAGDVLKDLYDSKDCVNEQIRMLQVGWSTPTEPTNEVANHFSWKSANQATIPNFTAVGYIFGKHIQEELGCPVGLISNPVGGSSIEFWLSDDNYQKVQESYKSYTTNEVYMTPSLGYNGMLYPLTGINLRGILWYQGESNAFGTQAYYDVALKIFMDQCREMFGNEQLGFTICELARYEGNPYAYSIVNEKINQVAEDDSHVVVARNLDLGEWKDIHPKDKHEIGRRAAYETLRVFFKKDKPEPIKIIDYSFNSDGSVTFELSKNASLVNGTNGFEVCIDGAYTYACNAHVDGNELTLSADGKITKVRYGYTCKMTSQIQQDVSKMVTVYDENGFPLDLFIIENKVQEDEKPELPPAPTLAVGWCDQGYAITTDEETGEYVVNKYAKALQWEGAMLDISGYASVYSSFKLKMTTTNVKKFTIELIVFGGEPDWAENISVYNITLADGEHDITVDFSEVQPISTTNWDYVPGYYIKDYQIAAIKFVLDTQSQKDLIKEDATCVINELTFIPEAPVEEGPYEDDEVFVATDSTLSFSNENSDKIITEPTFDVKKYTNNAGTKIKPYPLFASGMCLQRDAINRIWGTATNTENIAIEIKGKVYYGTVNDGNWEVYLPKMMAGGPYNLTIISEAGRISLTKVYIGEVFLLSGQSNMEWQPQHAGDVLKDLYESEDCINDQIRMLQVGWSTPTTPSTTAISYAQWKGANQSTIPNFTAVGYIFGRAMQKELGCPVGLIANPVGGSSIEFWLSDANYQKVQESYKSYTTTETYMTPSLGYNGMLYPLTGINLRGILWYQGESNAFGTQAHYDVALKIFMEQCREMFNNDELGFTICELARYEGNPQAYSIVNERINAVAKEDSHVVVARNLDLGEWNDIHPKDKHEIGRRAAYETLRVFFKQDKPEPVKVTNYTFNEDGTVTIELSNNASLVNGTNGFEVYVNGSYTYTCEVSMNGNKLIVKSSEGKITKVRYGYTCKMTTEIKQDVSKMVTVYDDAGFPLDLFLISK